MRRRKAHRSEQGSQVVEFALIAPIMMFLVLAIPVFGLLVRSWIVISGAAREGARAAALWHKGITTQERILSAREKAVAAVGLERDKAGRTVGKGDYFREEEDVAVGFDGKYVVVTVTYRQDTFVPLLGRLLSSSSPEMKDIAELKASARFLMEGPP